MRNVRHSSGLKMRTGPWRSLESRTATMPGQPKEIKPSIVGTLHTPGQPSLWTDGGRWHDRCVTRPRHPVKELEVVLREAEARRWRVTRDKRYFKLWCPNGGKCRKTVHLTPSGARYEENLRHYLKRYTCWDLGQEDRP